MSTDTALSLGVVALLTPRSATRLRVFLLTLAVVDDLAALLVIAIVYTNHVSVVALAVAVIMFALLLALRYLRCREERRDDRGALGLWVAMFKSGIDPVISGLAVGLATSAYPPAREDLERATALTRSFREQPTPELARSAQQSLLSSISPNERLQYEFTLDQLSDRATVRARQRRHPPDRQADRRRGLLADHARDHLSAI